MAIPADLPAVGTQDPRNGDKQRRGRMTAVYAQFEAPRPIQPPPLKLLSIGGDGQDSIALK